MANSAAGEREHWWLRWYITINFLFHSIMTALDSDDMMATMDDDEDIRNNKRLTMNDDIPTKTNDDNDNDTDDDEQQR